jgi:hypothetical protein
MHKMSQIMILARGLKGNMNSKYGCKLNTFKLFKFLKRQNPLQN